MTPPFIMYESVEEYKRHYENKYCKKGIITFDDIVVYFSKDKFSHAFYESSDRRGSKDIFSYERAQRIDWIAITLENANAKLYQGWSAKRKKYEDDGRVSIIYENFVVVIRLSLKKDGTLKGNFVTCYQADNSIEKIRKSPIWDKEKCLEKLKK